MPCTELWKICYNNRVHQSEWQKMSTEKISVHTKKPYIKPQLITYGSIAELTNGFGSQVDGFHTLGQQPGTVPPPPSPTPFPG
jgi:hypothetical protein